MEFKGLPVEKFVNLFFGEQVFKVLPAAIRIFSAFLFSAVDTKACVKYRTQPFTKCASLLFGAVSKVMSAFNPAAPVFITTPVVIVPAPVRVMAYLGGGLSSLTLLTFLSASLSSLIWSPDDGSFAWAIRPAAFLKLHRIGILLFCQPKYKTDTED